MIPIALASEFPNDNPALHGGAIWVIETPCAMPIAEPVELRVARMVEELVHDLVDAEALAPGSARALASALAPAPALAADEPLSLDLSHEPALAAHPAFFDEGSDLSDDEEPIEIVDDLDAVDAREPSPPDAFTVFVRTLAEVAVAAGASDAAAAIADALANEAAGHAWRAILNGESEDFAACGAKPLDEWAAELVARVIAAPSKSEQLRRELRSRGVAAFGMLG